MEWAKKRRGENSGFEAGIIGVVKSKSFWYNEG